MSRRVCISATFTAEPIEVPLTLVCNRAGLTAGIEFAPYNQVFQQLLDPGSTMARNGSGANLIMVRLEDWMGHASHEWMDGMPQANRTAPRTAKSALCWLPKS